MTWNRKLLHLIQFSSYSQIFWFFDIFRGYRNVTLRADGLEWKIELEQSFKQSFNLNQSSHENGFTLLTHFSKKC